MKDFLRLLGKSFAVVFGSGLALLALAAIVSLVAVGAWHRLLESGNKPQRETVTNGQLGSIQIVCGKPPLVGWDVLGNPIYTGEKPIAWTKQRYPIYPPETECGSNKQSAGEPMKAGEFVSEALLAAPHHGNDLNVQMPGGTIIKEVPPAKLAEFESRYEKSLRRQASRSAQKTSKRVSFWVIEMPNGTVITRVPLGITESQLMCFWKSLKPWQQYARTVAYKPCVSK